MEITKVVNGTNGFEAAGFAKSVLLNQLGFNLSRALFQATTQTETPVFDARLAAAMGDNGLPERTILDADSLAEGYAAAFILLTRHVKNSNPETGRRPEHLIQYIRTPEQVIKRSVDFRLTKQADQIKATAKMLKADPTARLEAVKKEQEAQAAALTAPVMEFFLNKVAEMRDWENDALLDCAIESLTAAGKNVATELKNAAVALIDAQKKRFEEGKFATVDAGIYALAGATEASNTTEATVTTKKRKIK